MESAGVVQQNLRSRELQLWAPMRFFSFFLKIHLFCDLLDINYLLVVAFFDVEAVGIRYGKYCGVGWTGCPGEKPCDDVDACCKIHDDCVGNTGSAFLIKFWIWFDFLRLFWLLHIGFREMIGSVAWISK